MSRFFPPAQSADEDGLLAVGGSLSTQRLLDAYRHGIFPWPMSQPSNFIPWVSPDPRAIIELNGLRISRRLARTCRGEKFSVTSDRDFAGVMACCGVAQDRAEHTWINRQMIAAYRRLHELGHAHSVEVWHEDELAGGIYGVTIGGLFAGESMFYTVRDASKVAIVHLVEHLRQRGYRLFDVQVMSPHLASLGAIEIPRTEYLARLSEVVDLPVEFGTLNAP